MFESYSFTLITFSVSSGSIRKEQKHESVDKRDNYLYYYPTSTTIRVHMNITRGDTIIYVTRVKTITLKYVPIF